MMETEETYIDTKDTASQTMGEPNGGNETTLKDGNKLSKKVKSTIIDND